MTLPVCRGTTEMKIVLCPQTRIPAQHRRDARLRRLDRSRVLAPGKLRFTVRRWSTLTPSPHADHSGYRKCREDDSVTPRSPLANETSFGGAAGRGVRVCCLERIRHVIPRILCLSVELLHGVAVPPSNTLRTDHRILYARGLPVSRPNAVKNLFG